MPRRRQRDTDLPTGVYKHDRRYRLRTVEEGRVVWVNLGTDRAAALQEWAKLTGQRTDSMRALFDRYEREQLAPGAKAPRTIKEQKRQLKTLRKVFEGMHPTDIKTHHAIEYLDRRGNVAGNREIALLRHCFTKFRHWGAVEVNPFLALNYRNPERPRTLLVTDAQLCHALRSRHALIRRLVWLAYLTGIRRGDLLALTRYQCKAEGIEIAEGKTGKRVVIAWTPSLEKVVRRLRQDSPDYRLFPLSQSGIDSAWQRLQRKLPKAQRWQLRDLRARHAADFEDKGGDATKQLGHSDRRVTIRHYLRRPRTVVPIR